MKIWQKLLLYYSAIAFIWLWPLFLNFGNLAGHGDAWQFVWNIWWVKKVLLNSSLSLFFTNYLHWPYGISLILQTFTFANSILGVLLSYVFGLVRSYNILIVANILAAALSMYYLSFYITRSKWPSFVSGFIFAFSPFHITHFYGHLHLWTIFTIPLSILFLLKTLNGEKKSFLWAGFFCAITAYVDFYYFLFLFLLCVFILIWKRPTDKKALTNLLLICIVVLVLAGPYIGMIIFNISTNADFKVFGHDPFQNSNTIKSVFLPGGRSGWNILKYNYWRFENGWRENGSYIGYSILIALLYGIYRFRNKEIFFWIISGVVFLLLSFYGPYSLLEKIFPLIKIAGVPLRFVFGMTFCFSIACAIVLSKIAVLKQGKALIFLFFAVAFVEFIPAKVDVSPVIFSPYYNELAKEKDKFAIIDVSDNESKTLFAQTIHDHPLVGGYTTRPTVSASDFIEKEIVIKEILNYQNISYDTVPPDNGLEELKKMNIKYILIPPYEIYTKQYIAKLGLNEAYHDDKLISYRVY